MKLALFCAITAVFLKLTIGLSAQSIQGLGHLHGPVPSEDYFWETVANAVSNEGVIVGDFRSSGGAFGDPEYEKAAWIYKDGEFTELPFTRANWISPDGRVIVGEKDLFDSQGGFIETQFVRWELIKEGEDGEEDEIEVTESVDGPIIKLDDGIPEPVPNKEAYQQANGKWKEVDELNGYSIRSVSTDGKTFVGNKFYPGQTPDRRAVVWTEETETLIPQLPGNDIYMEALAASGDGSIVVGKANVPFGPIYGDVEVVAFKWDKANGTRLLTDIAEESIDDWDPFWDLDSANGISENGRFVVGHGCYDGENVEPWIMELPGVRIDINISEDTFYVGLDLIAEVTITSALPDPVTVTMNHPLLVPNKEAILEIDRPEEEEPFILNSTETSRSFSVPIRIIKSGIVEITAMGTAVRADGKEVQLMGTAEIEVNPLDTQLTITNSEHLLNQTPETDWSGLAQELNADRREAQLNPYQNLIEAKLEIENTGNEPIKNLNIPGVLDVLSLISSTDIESPGVPLTPILLITPDDAAVEPIIDLTTPDSDITIADVDLDPGEKVSFTWILEAFDGNPAPGTDDSANLEFKVLILASLEGENIQSLPRSEFTIIDQLLLEWGIKPRENRTNYLSGQNVWVDAYIENVSEASGFPKDLLVMVFQTPEGNVGGGYLVEAGQNLAQTEPKDDPDFYQFFVLPGEGKTRMDLQAFFRTIETQEPSEGHVEYDVRIWVINEDDSLTNADNQTLLKDENGWLREFDVTLKEQNISDVSVLIDECLEAGLPPWLCGASEGIYNKLGAGLVDLMAYGIELGKQTTNLTLLMTSESIQAMIDLWKGLLGDEVAMSAFVQELYVQYRTLVELGVMAGEAGSNTPMAIGQFSQIATESFADFMFKLETGDAKQRQLIIGEFLGANPDLLLEPLIALRGFKSMRLVMHEIAEGSADNYMAAAQKQRAEQIFSTTASRVQDAFSAGKDAAKALRAGDKLTNDMMLRIYGITKKQLEALQDIAEQFKVVLTFRSRNPLSVDLLESGLARPKPQALKHKTVNDIDVEYLGYPGDARATIGIVEPPKELQGITSDVALLNAVDIYVDELAKVHPKLANDDVLRYEVADRLKTRVEEWDELVPRNPETDEVLETYQISVAFDGQTQFASKAGTTVKVDDVRTVQQKSISTFQDPVTGEFRRRFELKTTGPPGEGEGASVFKAITGDVDFLAILEPNGMMITDVERRIKIYEALASTIGIQHGESYTFFLQKAREKYLRCCVAGALDAEAMVAIGPGKRKDPRAAYFVDNSSLMRDGPNKQFLGPQNALRDRYFRVVRKKGEPVLIRREDVSGEFMLLDGYPQNLSVRLDLVSYFQPKVYRQILSDWFKRFVFFAPTYVARILESNESQQQSLPVKHANNIEIRIEEEAVYSVDAPILQIDESAGFESIRQWTEEEGWLPISRADAFALGGQNIADMAPMSPLFNFASAGSTVVEILSLSELEATGRFFEAGDRVVIDPGQTNEECAVVASLEPFTLTGPLVFDHDTGAMVAFLEPDVMDLDGDNLSDRKEELHGTLPYLFDTDGDGLSDSQELAYGTNPTDSNSRFEFANIQLANETGELDVSWVGITDKTYTIEGSYDLNIWFEIERIEATQDGPIDLAIDFATDEGVTRFVRIRLGQ